MLDLLPPPNAHTRIAAPHPKAQLAAFRTALWNLVDEGAFGETDRAIRHDLRRRLACHAWLALEHNQQIELVRGFYNLSVETRCALEAISDADGAPMVGAFLALSDTGRTLVFKLHERFGDSFEPHLATSVRRWNERREQRENYWRLALGVGHGR